MKRSTDRILTTHTGSLPRTAKVVELLLAEQKTPGQRKAELGAAVREAVAHVVQKQIECGLDIVNDGEQGRTDYTVHVLDRLTGYDGPERAADGHRRRRNFPSSPRCSSISPRRSSTGRPAAAM